jgi:hypothetical protein
MFSSFGFYGLFGGRAHEKYQVEVYEAFAPHWSGRADPREKRLQEVFQLLLPMRC